jgi:thioredoxin-like negative regulator of GroEL
MFTKSAAILSGKYILAFSASLLLLLSACSDKKEAPAAPRTILSVPAEQMRDTLADSYRLRPDKRFLNAVAAMENFFSGKKREPVSAEFKNGYWMISYRGKEVGSLPELPDFGDFLAVLSNWSQALNNKYPLKLSAAQSDVSIKEINKELSQFLAPHSMAAVRKVDALWNQGERNPALLYAAVQGLVQLAFQEMDRLEIGDELPARALAILAITKELTGRDCLREEALLAYEMGYSSYAASIAGNLPLSDPVGAYVSQDHPRLQQLAEEEGSTIESHYLHLMDVGSKEDVRPLITCLETYFADSWLSLPVFKAAMENYRFAIAPDLSEALPSLVLLALAQDAGALPEITEYLRKAGTQLESRVSAVIDEVRSRLPIVVANFESGLQQLETKYTGPFLDSETYKAYYSGYFFSSLHELGMHYLDKLSSQQAANEFAAVLGKADQGTAEELGKWYANLARSKEEKIDLVELSSQTTTILGAAPFMRTFEEQERYYQYGDPLLLKGIKELLPRMDSRIEHRAFLGNIAFTGLLDLKLTEKLLSSVLKDSYSKHAYMQVWLAGFSNDCERLLAILDSTLEFQTRIQALAAVERQEGMDPQLIKKRYEQFLKEDPDDFSVRFSYAAFLKKSKQYSYARSVLKEWLKRGVPVAGLENIATRTMIARLYYEEGKYKKGWDEIKGDIKSYKGDAMHIAALLLNKLGRKAEADKLAVALVERYPDNPDFRVVLAELFWERGRYAEAAEILKISDIKAATWQFEIGPKFAELFKDKHDEAVLSAFAALLQKFSAHDLLGVVRSLSKAGRNELAFKITSEFKAGGLEKLVFLVESYKYLSAYQTKEEALTWLRSAVPPQMLNPSSMISYDQGQFELLWDLIPDPVQGEGSDFVWLMRAAAAIRAPLEDQHYKKLLEYYSGDGDSYYFKIGKFLLGRAEEKDILELMTDGKKRCECAYYIGLKAQTEGRYHDASDWYRLAVETGLIKNGEYRWAYNALYKWYSEGKRLDLLAKQKV